MGFLVVLLSLGAVSHTLAADYNTVRADVATILDLLQAMNKDVANVVSGPGNIPYALQVQVDAVGIHKELLTAYDNAKASPAFGSGSFSVGLDLINAQPKISDALQQFTEKAEEFGDLGVIVLSSLYQLKADTSSFSDAVTEKLGPLEQALAPVVVKKIQDSKTHTMRLLSLMVEKVSFSVRFR
jgi:hypothetical protein